MDSLTDKSFLQIVFNLQIIRIYWIKNAFFLTHDILDNFILYDSYKNSSKVVTYVMKQIHHAINIDVKVFYNSIEMFAPQTATSKKNTESIKNMMDVDNGDYSEHQDIKRLILLNLLILCA